MEPHVCRCGCGSEIPSSSSWARGHNAKRGNPEELGALRDPNPGALCMCGCGLRAPLAAQSSIRDGWVKGRPMRFITGHNGKFLTGPARRQWKGGKIRTDEGYYRIRVGAPGDRRYVLEHRYVMEQHLGRSLIKLENVHHLNGDKTDNRIENLELWNRSQPCGQRIKDKVRWALEIIALYPEVAREQEEAPQGDTG